MVLPCKNGIFSVAFTPFFTAVNPCGPTRCGAASGPRQCPLTVPPRAGALKRTWDTPEDRVTARVTPHEGLKAGDKSTSKVGLCEMSRSFGTLVQLNTLLKVCNKLGLARHGRMSDL